MSIWFFFGSGETSFTIRHRVLLRQTWGAEGRALVAGLTSSPSSQGNGLVTFAKAPNGWVYWANGLDPVFKWDGVWHSALTAGVIAPTTAMTISGTGSGTITGTYTAYVRYVDRDGFVSNLSPVSNEITVTGVGNIVYANVEQPTEDKILKRQIFRNVNGSTLVYYLDIETEDLDSTTFTSTKTDLDLLGSRALALFDDEGRSIANRFAPPPNDKPLIVYYANRMFLMGDVTYSAGHVHITANSTTVQGYGTQFTEAMENRFLYIIGQAQVAEIETVDEIAQTLTLTEEWTGQTVQFAEYSVRSPPAQRTLVYWSESGNFDAWPAGNTLEFTSSDDIEEETTAGIATQSFLYIVQRRHIYRLSFFKNPLSDGGIFLAARRGCVNQRCVVHVDGFIYLLDDRGVYRFDGSDQTEDLSTAIQDLFWVDNLAGEFRVNWSGSQWFHAVHDRNDATIRWFVALAGEYLPRFCIAYNYQVPQWWIEEYAWPIGCSEVLRKSNPIAIVSGHKKRLFAVGLGTLDKVRADQGQTRGTMTAAGPTWFEDTVSALPDADMTAAPVTIVSGKGKGQMRYIANRVGDRFNVTQPWLETPDTTSVFQLGGFPWRWRSPWFSWGDEEEQRRRGIFAAYRPTSSAAEMDIRYYEDYDESPTAFPANWPPDSAQSSGVVFTQDSPDAVADLSRTGYAQVRLDDWEDQDVWTPNKVSVELRGVSGKDQIRIYELNIEGAQEG